MSCRGTHRLRWCGSSVGSDTSWKVQLIAVKPVWTKPMMQIKMSGNAIFGYIAQRKLVAFLLASSSMSIESVGWSRLVLLSEYIANSMGNFRKELVGCACTFTAILLETVLSALSFLIAVSGPPVFQVQYLLHLWFTEVSWFFLENSSCAVPQEA